MIQTLTSSRSILHDDDAVRPTLWGLTAVELHDAYWRSHGVQCIRRGQPEKLQARADLYLLIEPDQLVVFDVTALAERLAWRAAAATRLRVVGQNDEPYGEHVELDEQDRVKRIARRYRPQTHATYRVLITRRRRVARTWMAAEVRRTGWRRIRRSLGQANIDTWRSDGGCYSVGRASDERAMINRLAAVWQNPARAIEGIEEVRDDVWALRGTVLSDDAIVIGPAWLGAIEQSTPPCVIGPTWSADCEVLPGERRARLRAIAEIDPGDARDPAEPPHVAHLALPHALAKRTLDIVASSIGLAVVMPILALIAICILIEDGRPIFFGQARQTRGGKNFRCWKFRTMCRDADVIKRQLAAQNVCDGPQFFVKDDPRVTRVGRVLRKYYLDELPQLWNVLVGQMSLVGPRPSPDDENQICPAWRELRLSGGIL